MHSLRINGTGEIKGQPANLGSSGKDSLGDLWQIWPDWLRGSDFQKSKSVKKEKFYN